MFKTIMIPVDLGHAEQMSTALAVGADLAKHYGGQAHLVGVTQSGPTAIARTPEAFAEALEEYAGAQSSALGVTFAARAEVSHDITVDLTDALARAAEAIGADMVVMASHTPGLAEHVIGSNAGHFAAHAGMSVMIVR